MEFNEFIKQCWSTAESKGWHEDKPPITEKILLVHCELSEAVEALRDPKKNNNEFKEEIADVFIRLFDMCGEYKELDDIQTMIRWKMEKNLNRPHRHGKLF